MIKHTEKFKQEAVRIALTSGFATGKTPNRFLREAIALADGRAAVIYHHNT